ncbi:MAG: acireductone synthase [Planctomycetota bacterium]
MPGFSVRGVLLDIEGTTSAIAYVYDVMFPYARRELAAYLEDNWHVEACQAAAEQVARDAGHDGVAAWCEQTGADERSLVQTEVQRLMDADVKATGLKQLQGLIWQAGFESGELRAHVFDDVPPALANWRDAGIDLRVYSSGSVHAQKLFFGNTASGDLLPRFSGHYDTTTGPKKEPASYTAIAHDWEIAPDAILFLSDVVAELDAAASAGMRTALVYRPGNQPVADDQPHPNIESFDQLELSPVAV